jgi:hypothetical protein
MPMRLKFPSTSDLFVRWLPLILLLAVIGNHMWYVSKHAINIPNQDDIPDTIQFVSAFESAESTGEILDALFMQYNDHRTSASRLLVLGIYLVEGELNFHTLTLVANLALPLILFLFYLTVKDEEYRWVYLLISALLLLNLRYLEIVLFSQAAFAYYFVFLYAFACIFMLHKVTGPRFVLAVAFGTLSSLTMASGQSVWLLGLASLLHQSLVSGRRSLVWPAMWLLVAAAILTLWHTGFTNIPHVITSEMVLAHNEMPPVPVEGEGFPDALVAPTLVQLLTRYAMFFPVILGCAPVHFSSLGAGIVGLLMLAMLSFITLRYYKHEDVRLVLYCWFVVAFAAAVTVGRAAMALPDYALVSRYSFLSVMLLCTLTLQVQVRFALFRTSGFFLVALLTGMYWGWANYHFEGRLQDYMRGRYVIFNQANYPVILRPVGESNEVVNKAISAGIYTPPCRPFPACENPPANAE